MDAEQSSLNPSSLLDLKAELHKKYDSFKRAKLSQKVDTSRSSTFKYKGQTIPKEKKSASKFPLKSSEETSEEDLALKKSQLALEAKARLYEKLTSSNILIDDEDGEKYLVDFNRKVLYAEMPDKSVEKKSPVFDANYVSSETSESFRKVYKEKLVTSDNQTDKLDINQPEQPIHYQNVQFNEVRDHGTGYFAFSMHESKRKEQMEELNKLRQQTEDERLHVQRMQRKRKAMLEARLAKVCERRNIDKSVVQSYTKTLESTEDSSIEQSVDLSSIPLPEIPNVIEKKEVKVRPWDVGKTDFPLLKSEKHKIKNQRDWIEDRRSERQSEFAPPSSYC